MGGGVPGTGSHLNFNSRQFEVGDLLLVDLEELQLLHQLLSKVCRAQLL